MKHHNINLRLITASVLWLLLAGCSNTYVTNAWRDPTLTEPLHFNKIVTLAIHEDDTTRRVAEDEMARQIGPRAVPAYTLLSEEDRGDVNRIKARFQLAGMDDAVTMKLLSKRVDSTRQPSISYGSLYEYYGTSRHYSPGYTVEDTIATVETRIYSVREGKLIWSATTETYNPEEIRKDIDDIADAVKAELRKEKLFASAQGK
jgi:hypothetical protein